MVPKKENSKKTKKEDEVVGKAVEETTAPPKENATGAQVEAQLAAIGQKLEEAEKEVATVKDRLLRTSAEYDNYRKRSQKEFESAFGNGVAHAANQLLVVLDTLDAAANTETEDAEYKKGVLLTLEKCKEVFSKLGITEIDALGQPFDPELHNAVMQDAAEGAESGTITKVMQKGYLQNDKVIRHSMVAVAP